MGRYPAEIAEGGGVLGGGKRDLHRSRFQQLPWSTASVSLKKPQKGRLQSMEPTHPDRQLENVTAPSAGGSPDPDGEVRLRMRLPFRTNSNKSPESYPNTMIRRVRVRVRVRGGAEQSDHCRNRNRYRYRYRSLLCIAPGPLRTATVRLDHPVSRARIPARVLSIPRPIATPTPILIRR